MKLHPGTRVRHREHGYVGTVVEANAQSNRRFTYVVRWDGFEHDSGEYGIRSLDLATTGDEQMSVEEATQRLLGSVLVQFEDRADDDLLPIRSLWAEIGEMCGVRSIDLDDIPEWETMGWLRERTRAALARLASGEKIP